MSIRSEDVAGSNRYEVVNDTATFNHKEDDNVKYRRSVTLVGRESLESFNLDRYLDSCDKTKGIATLL